MSGCFHMSAQPAGIVLPCALVVTAHKSSGHSPWVWPSMLRVRLKECRVDGMSCGLTAGPPVLAEMFADPRLSGLGKVRRLYRPSRALRPGQVAGFFGAWGSGFRV